MKDMPMFTTENGAAGLILREIPYTARAYIRIHSSCAPAELIRECADFCRAVGAEEIYATGDAALEAYPFHTAILRLRCPKDALGDTEAALWPVQESTLLSWKKIYNEKAVNVPNGAWMTDADCLEMLRAGDGYFIHRDDTLLGIGRAGGEQIRWVAACVPGAGADVVKALAHAITADTVTLEVASANEKAIGLYESLGFIPVAELSRWYRVK